MSTARGAKLKAEYNRVRTSTSLKGNDMWSKTIGQEANPQAGSNAAVEAQIYAPTHGGSKRAERQANAQQLVQKVGYNAQVTDYQGLLDLAKTQGSFGTGEKVRGACKKCGGLGHTTKQCTNFLTGHTATAGPVTSAVGMPEDRGLLPAPGELSDLEDLSGSSSSSGSDSEDEGSKRSKSESRDGKKHKKDKKHKKRKRDSDDEGKKKKKHKKHKKHKHSKDKKDKKHKKEKHHKHSSSSSDSD